MLYKSEAIGGKISDMAKILLAGEICAEKQYLMDSIPLAKEVSFVNSVNTLTSSKIINAGRVLA